MKKQLRKWIVIIGGSLSLLFIINILLTHFDRELVLSPLYGLILLVLSFIIPVVGYFFLSVKFGKLSFRDAFILVFSAFIISILIETLFSYILYNFIAPDYGQELHSFYFENVYKPAIEQSLSDKPEEMTQQLKELKEEYSFSGNNLFKSIPIRVGGGALKSLVLAGFYFLFTQMTTVKKA